MQRRLGTIFLSCTHARLSVPGGRVRVRVRPGLLTKPAIPSQISDADRDRKRKVPITDKCTIHDPQEMAGGRLGVYGLILGRLPLGVFSIGKLCFARNGGKKASPPESTSG